MNGVFQTKFYFYEKQRIAIIIANSETSRKYLKRYWMENV